MALLPPATKSRSSCSMQHFDQRIFKFDFSFIFFEIIFTEKKRYDLAQELIGSDEESDSIIPHDTLDVIHRFCEDSEEHDSVIQCALQNTLHEFACLRQHVYSVVAFRRWKELRASEPLKPHTPFFSIFFFAHFHQKNSPDTL